MGFEYWRQTESRWRVVEICVECEEAKRREKREERSSVGLGMGFCESLERRYVIANQITFSIFHFFFFLVFYFLFKINLSFENGVD